MHLEDRILLLHSRRPRLAGLLMRIVQFLRGFEEVGRRSMQRFTPLGRLLLGFYAVSLVFVVDTRATMNYQLFALLLTLLVLCFALSLRARLPEGRMHSRRILPSSATVGSPLQYELVLRNSSQKPQASLQVVESLEPEHAGELPRPSELHVAGDSSSLRVGLAWRRLLLGDERAMVREARVPALLPGSEGRVRISATPASRGVLRFRRSSLATPDPLGLFRSFTPLPAGETLLVLPRRYPLPRFSLPGGRRHQPGGLRLASRVGEEGEFASLREYRRGDPLRHIHWRSWARHGKPIVKEFQEEFFTRHGLVLDTFPDPKRLPGRRDALCFEAAVSLAASFVAAPRDQDTLLDLLFVGDTAHCVTAGRGLGSEEQLLEVLAGVSPSLDPPSTGGSEPESGFPRLAALVREHAPLVSGCVCILLGWDKVRQDMVRHLRESSVETLVLLLPCPGLALSAAMPEAGVQVLDPENLEAGLAGL